MRYSRTPCYLRPRIWQLQQLKVTLRTHRQLQVAQVHLTYKKLYYFSYTKGKSLALLRKQFQNTGICVNRQPEEIQTIYANMCYLETSSVQPRMPCPYMEKTHYHHHPSTQAVATYSLEMVCQYSPWTHQGLPFKSICRDWASSSVVEYLLGLWMILNSTPQELQNVKF